jgi:hypothetical protein
MPSFTLTARVVLHKDDARAQEHSPDAKEYDTLHKEMHSRGYRRCYTGKDKVMYQLLPGEYKINLEAEDGVEARTKAMDKAIAAATIATSKERHGVYVTGGDSVRGHQLKVITKDPDAN